MSLSSYTSQGQSGSGLATSQLAPIKKGGFDINRQVIIQVLDKDKGAVEVIFNGSTEGIVVHSGTQTSFYVDDLGKIFIKRFGLIDTPFRYWAF